MLKRVQHDGEKEIAVILNLFQDLFPGRTTGNDVHGTVSGSLYRYEPEARDALHRSGTLAGFTRRYGCKRLVLIEFFGDMEHAILREKQLKRWHRDWKINLIEASNPDWRDLAVDYGFQPLAARSGRAVDAETSSA